jgi:hypothetical protein
MVGPGPTGCSHWITGQKSTFAIGASEDEYSRRKQIKILNLFSTIDYREDYDYKANRRRDRILSERHCERRGLGRKTPSEGILEKFSHSKTNLETLY